MYAIQIDRTLIFGSAACVPDAYQGLKTQTVVLGIGGLGSKSQAYLEELYQQTVLGSGARNVWLSHWDNFFTPGHRGVVPMGFASRIIRRIVNLGNYYGQSVNALPYGRPIQL